LKKKTKKRIKKRGEIRSQSWGGATKEKRYEKKDILTSIGFAQAEEGYCRGILFKGEIPHAKNGRSSCLLSGSCGSEGGGGGGEKKKPKRETVSSFKLREKRRTGKKTIWAWKCRMGSRRKIFSGKSPFENLLGKKGKNFAEIPVKRVHIALRKKETGGEKRSYPLGKKNPLVWKGKGVIS